MKQNFLTLISLVLATVLALGLCLSSIGAAVPTAELPFTGDHTPFTLIAVLMGVALVVIVVVIISLVRKK